MLRKSASRQTPPPVAKQTSSPALPVRRLLHQRPSNIRESWSFVKDRLNNSYSAMRKTRAMSVGSRSQTANGKKFHSVDHGHEHMLQTLKHQSVDSGLWGPVWTQGAQTYGVFHGYQMECVKVLDTESSN
jgi:hypothetical protein